MDAVFKGFSWFKEEDLGVFAELFFAVVVAVVPGISQPPLRKILFIDVIGAPEALPHKSKECLLPTILRLI